MKTKFTISNAIMAIMLTASMFLLAVMPLKANDMQIIPTSAKQGANITLEYSISKGSMPETANFVLYSYNNRRTSAIAIDIPAEINGAANKISATYTLPNDIEYGIVKLQYIKNGHIINVKNFGEYWDIFIIGEDGKKIQSSNLLASVSYMGSTPMNREPDFDKALALLKEERKLYPNSLQAEIGYTSFLFDIRKSTPKEYQASMKDLLSKPFDKDNERIVSAITSAMKTMNAKSKANDIISEFVEKHPQSDIAQDQILNKLSDAENLKQFSAIAEYFLKQFPHSPKRKDVSNAIVKAYLQSGDMIGLYSFVHNNNLESPDIHIATAQTVLQNGNIFKSMDKKSRIDTAISIYNKALEIQKDLYEIEIVKKPELASSVSKFDYIMNLKQKMAFFYEVGGDMYILTDTAKAIGFYHQAIQFSGTNSNDELYRKLYNLYVEKQDCANAYATIEKSVANSAFFENIEDLFIDAYILCKSGTEEEAGNEYQKLLDIARTIRFETLKDIELNKTLKESYLKRADDKIIQASDFLSYTTILTFYSSWCGPCQATIPAIESLYEFYKSNDMVLMASIDVWEESDKRKDKLLEFKKQYDIEYPLLYDETDIIMRNLSITGLPYTVILDKKGLVRFKISGFKNTDDYIREITDIVDYLNSEEK